MKFQILISVKSKKNISTDMSSVDFTIGIQRVQKEIRLLYKVIKASVSHNSR